MKKLFTLFSMFSLTFFLLSCGGGNKENTELEKDIVEETPTEKIENSIVGEEISYEADGISMKGYIAYDKSKKGKRPAILVVHEWWGHNDYTRKRADMLAELGYIALAVDMYGDGKKAEHPKDAMKFAGAVNDNFEGAKARFNKALEQLKTHPMANAEQTAAIGYCFGGGIVLNMARSGADLDAVASFHGSLGAVKPMEEGVFNGKIAIFNGADDTFVTAEQIESLKSEMDNANVAYKFVNLEGAVHGFTNPEATKLGEEFDMKLAYNEQADLTSWKQMQEMLNEVFGMK